MPRCDPYVIEVDWSRNYHSYGKFEHLERDCENQGILRQERRLKYGDNSNNT